MRTQRMLLLITAAVALGKDASERPEGKQGRYGLVDDVGAASKRKSRRVMIEYDAEPQQPGPVAFLRVQKTASTSFGETYLKAICGHYGQTCAGESHLDFRGATRAAGAQGKVVMILRDPVDRVISEYNYVRKNPEYLGQEQWDVAADDLQAVAKAVKYGDLATSFSAFLDARDMGRYPRNRQALYLLGFDRVACRPGVGLNHAECSDPPGFGRKSPVPATAYDWDSRFDALLAQATEHLGKLAAFGFTECLEDSVKRMAPALHWGEDVVERALGNKTLGRQETLAHKMLMGFGVQRSCLSPALLDRVREQEALDLKLYEYAQKEYASRHGACVGDRKERPCSSSVLDVTRNTDDVVHAISAQPTVSFNLISEGDPSELFARLR